MKPYFEHRGAKIYLGTWSEAIDSVDSQIDCCITDPPYGETSLAWDKSDIEWLASMDRLIAPAGSIWSFGSLRYMTALLSSPAMLTWRHAQEIVWEKHNGSGFQSDRFKRVHELAVQLYRVSTAWDAIYKNPIYSNDATARTLRRKRRPAHMGNIEASEYASHDGGPRLMTSVIYERNCHGYADHPTQKPLGILRLLIEYSCPPGGIVIDPFMGSGSTLVAAIEQGRGAVGIEIEERYCEAAARRLSQEILSFT